MAINSLTTIFVATARTRQAEVKEVSLDYTPIATDLGTTVHITGVLPITVFLPATLVANYLVAVINASAATVTLNPTVTLNAQGTQIPTLGLAILLHLGAGVWEAYGELI